MFVRSSFFIYPAGGKTCVWNGLREPAKTPHRLTAAANNSQAQLISHRFIELRRQSAHAHVLLLLLCFLLAVSKHPAGALVPPPGTEFGEIVFELFFTFNFHPHTLLKSALKSVCLKNLIKRIIIQLNEMTAPIWTFQAVFLKIYLCNKYFTHSSIIRTNH